MSNVCSSSPFFSDEDQYLELHSPFGYSEFQSSADTPTMENNPDVVIIDEEGNEAVHATTAGVEQANAANNEPEQFTKKRRKHTSSVWEHFREITLKNGTSIHECIHCGEKVKKHQDGTTTPMKRHIDQYCPKLKAADKGQLKLKVPHGKSVSSSTVQNWKFDNARMREVIAHMIMIHELPFNFVEYEIFNVVMKEANPAFIKISRTTAKQDCFSSDDDWKKVEDVCSFLALFSVATKIISGSEYPTSNLFSSELYGIKEALDGVALYDNDCMKGMAEEMKKKFDKYWGSCNLLISIGAVMDPRYKMKLIDFAFKEIYPEEKAKKEKELVQKYLDDLFKEYVNAYKEPGVGSDVGSSRNVNVESGSGSSSLTSRFGKGINTGSAKYAQHIRTVDCVESVKSELATYLEGVYICEQGVYFNALGGGKRTS